LHRLKDAFESRRSSVLAGVVLLAVGISVIRLERFPEWDEAVFLSQSGGLNGIASAPAALAESREMGTPTLIGLIRLLVETLANTRLLWIVVSIALLVAGAVMISRLVGAPSPLLVFGYGSYWLGLTFIGSFYGFFIAAGAALLAVGCYLSLRASDRRQVLIGLAFGASLAMTLWFRQIEGFLVATCLLVHAILVSPRDFWRLRLRGALTSVGSVTVLFVIPWVIDSTVRYGSVAERITVGRNQEFERGLYSHVAEYWDVLIGHSFHYATYGPSPRWATSILAVLVIGLAVVGLVGPLTRRSDLARTSSDGVRIGALPLVWAIGVVLTSFFMFFIGTVRDRYLLMGLVFLATGLIAGAWRLVESGRLDLRLVATALAGLALVWAVSNVAIAGVYEKGRFESGSETEYFARTLQRLAAGRDCLGVSRFGAPQIQFGSGCVTETTTSADDAAAWAAGARAPGRLVFVSWPSGDADSLDLTSEEWTEIPRSPDGEDNVVVLWSDGT
jgi:hypothetical protein